MKITTKDYIIEGSAEELKGFFDMNTPILPVEKPNIAVEPSEPKRITITEAMKKEIKRLAEEELLTNTDIANRLHTSNQFINYWRKKLV